MHVASRPALLAAALALATAAQAQAPTSAPRATDAASSRAPVGRSGEAAAPSTAAPARAAASPSSTARAADAGTARPDGGADTDEDAPPAGTAVVTPKPVVASAEAPTFRIAGGKGTATLLQDSTTGATYASMTLLQLDAGAEVAEHHHHGAAELLFVQAGRAEVRMAGRTFTVSAGDAVHFPPGLPHSARILSAFRAVQVYSPGGAEQRFRAGAPVAPRVAPGKR